MGVIARAVYIAILGVCVLLFALSAIAGVWIWAIAAAVFGLVLAVTTPYVLGQKWRPEEPKSRTRAVSRRKR